VEEANRASSTRRELPRRHEDVERGSRELELHGAQVLELLLPYEAQLDAPPAQSGRVRSTTAGGAACPMGGISISTCVFQSFSPFAHNRYTPGGALADKLGGVLAQSAFPPKTSLFRPSSNDSAIQAGFAPSAGQPNCTSRVAAGTISIASSVRTPGVISK
jgi:hypothetical protein